MKIQEYLKENIIITDGAMGTYFDEMEEENYRCSEEANIANPSVIRKIHEDYIKAGANLIRSNTFSANRLTLRRLQEEKRGLWNQISLGEFAASGFRIAKEAADFGSTVGKKIYAAADIGPLYEGSESETKEILAQYYELCDIFLEEGAEIFVLETFPDEKYVIKIAEYLKKKNPNLFVIGQFSFVPTGYSRTGFYYKNVLNRAIESKVLDAVGLNCGIGAAHMAKLFRSYVEENGLPKKVWLTALPNRGYPQIVRGRAVYSDSVTYFGEKVMEIASLGIRIFGGCCGTTPEYIAEVFRRNLERPLTVEEKDLKFKKIRPKKETEKRVQKNLFREKLERGEPVFAVELDPPFDISTEKIISGAKALADTSADIITIADSPLARSRADSILMAVKLRMETGMDVMPHLACRDRNRIAFRSAMLGAHIHGIRNLLLVTGDPVGREEREFTKSVFDFNSIKLMEFLKGMNEDVFSEEPFFYGGALNQNGANLDRIAERMRKKMEAGCRYFLTQPVYSKEDIGKIAFLKEKTGAKILIGIMPLVSYRNALFIKNEMPGIFVPDEILKRYREEGTRQEWETEAVKLAGEMMEAGEGIGAGYYLMTPFNRISLIRQILRGKTQLQ